MNSSKNWDIPVDIKYVYSQEADSCQTNSNPGQILEVEIQDAGGGNYLVIKTNRWAIGEEDIDKFCDLLKKSLKGHTGCRSIFEEDKDSENK